MSKSKKLQSSGVDWGQVIVDALREETKEEKNIPIEKAARLVKERIKGNRKGLEEPNYLHSFRVRDLVMKFSLVDDPNSDLFVAALLHDIVEDGGVSFDELKDMDFSDRTIELVKLCTHPMDIKNKTERWMRMVNRLIEANDHDAWRIKVADLADNLKQSKGLTLENREFMIDVKAPIFLRLAILVPDSPYSVLEKEIEKQKKELAEKSESEITFLPKYENPENTVI
ncbi:MAG: HD domain-containing protein [Candidatus Taylorbacteria bacterium]